MTPENRCYAGDRCRDYDRRDRVAALVDTGPLCEACLRMGERAIGQIVYDYRDLDDMLPRPLSRWFDGQPGGGRSRPAPVRESVDEVQRAMVWVAGLWHEVIADRLQLAAPPDGRRRPGHVVQRAAEVLKPRVRLLASIGPVDTVDYPGLPGVAQVSGAQAVLDFDRLHQRARLMLGLTRHISKLPGECSGCLRSDLRQDEPRFAEDPLTVYCGSCGRTWTRDEYETYVGLIIGSRA